ncbi:MAG TPA: restriction endonuclease subunit S, partial [Thermoanaerobaculia bacterium]
MSELPEGWAECTLGDLLEGIDAGRSFLCEERPPTHDEFGVVKISAVTWGTYDEEQSKTCTNPDLVEPSFLIEDGDLLLSRANTIELVGAAVIAEHVTKRIMLSDKILRLRTRPSVEKRWILYFLHSREGRAQIESLATGNQQSMRNIGQERLRSIVLPLPPLAEQRRIVEKVEALLSNTKALSEHLRKSRKFVDQARHAIVDAACRGDLTADWRQKRGISTKAWRRVSFSDIIQSLRNGVSPRPQLEPPGTPILR